MRQEHSTEQVVMRKECPVRGRVVIGSVIGSKKRFCCAEHWTRWHMFIRFKKQKDVGEFDLQKEGFFQWLQAYIDEERRRAETEKLARLDSKQR